MNNQNLDLPGFIDHIISEKREFEGLAPDVIAQIKLDLLGRAEDRINAVIISNIPEDKQDEFLKITEAGTAEEIHAFCESVIPDLAELIASELIVFRQTYLG